MPQRLRLGFGHSSNTKLSQAAIAAIGVGKLGNARTLFVNLFSLCGSHPLAKCRHLGCVTTFRCVRIFAFC